MNSRNVLLSFFFFSSRRRHTRLQGDWSSDVCSSDLLSTLLFALGIRHVGAEGARLLARHFGRMERLQKATAAEIGQIRGIGPAIAEAVAGVLAEPRNRKLVERLGTPGRNMREPQAAPGQAGRPPAGATYLVTRTLPAPSPAPAGALDQGAG